MESELKPSITIETIINAPVKKVWEAWTEPKHIMQWCQASDDWHAPYADNDAKTGGKFKTTMAARDGSFSFDFEGVYTKVQEEKLIEYDIADGRKVKIEFSEMDGKTKVVETFEAENANPIDVQRGGWQSILDNFRKHVETNL